MIGFQEILRHPAYKPVWGILLLTWARVVLAPLVLAKVRPRTPTIPEGVSPDILTLPQEFLPVSVHRAAFSKASALQIWFPEITAVDSRWKCSRAKVVTNGTTTIEKTLGDLALPPEIRTHGSRVPITPSLTLRQEFLPNLDPFMHTDINVSIEVTVQYAKPGDAFLNKEYTLDSVDFARDVSLFVATEEDLQLKSHLASYKNVDFFSFTWPCALAAAVLGTAAMIWFRCHGRHWNWQRINGLVVAEAGILNAISRRPMGFLFGCFAGIVLGIVVGCGMAVLLGRMNPNITHVDGVVFVLSCLALCTVAGGVWGAIAGFNR